MNLLIKFRSAAEVLLCLCASLLSAAVILSALPTKDEEALYDRVIRLHVIANSDSKEDQALKLRVRDAVLLAMNEQSRSVSSAAEADALYQSQLTALEDAARDVITDAGYAYDCRVTLTHETYPIRTYQAGEEHYTLPAGTYRSLRVMIGDAVGQNWWCVLFPPLCMSLASEYTAPDPDAAVPVSAVPSASTASGKEILLAAGFTPYEISLISGEGSPKTVVKFRIVEFFRKVFKK